TITTAGNHTIQFVGTGTRGTYTYLDDVKVTSLDAIFAAGIPCTGTANTYQNQLNSQAKYAESYGLHVVAYEGGWSLGGDTGGTPLQNYAKYVDARAEQANIDSLDAFTKSGGVLYFFGTYAQWPEYDVANAGTYPLTQGVQARNTSLPA